MHKPTLNSLKQALESDPDNAQLHHQYADLLAREKDYSNALKHYARAVQLQPDYLEAHYNLGLLFFRHAKISEATTQFNNVISLYPEHTAAHYQLGNLYLQQNKLDNAKVHYRQVLKLEPEHSNTLNNLGAIALKEQQPQQAIDYFTRALALDEHHLEARSNMAATFMQYDRYDNAKRHYKIILETTPKDLEANYNMGVALMCSGELEPAQTYFETVLTLETKHVDTLCNLAAIAVRLNDYATAKKHYQQAAQYQPDSPLIQYMLSSLTGNDTVEIPARAPDQYIENLFDNYAFFFDKHLKDVLHYQAPKLLHDALCDITTPPKHGWNILDLGCGTGLSAQPFVPYAKTLIGVDLSQRMLKEAKQKEIYSDLHKTDLVEFLQHSQQQFDLIIAADVFCYYGDLSELLQQAWQRLKPNGYCAFTVERTDHDDYTLQRNARYAHSQAYLDKLIESNPWTLKHFADISTRQQENNAVPGYLILLQKGS